MKFLVDMNLSPLWVQFLTDRGFEAVHWSTVGQLCGSALRVNPARPIPRSCSLPQPNGWVVFTHDLDFGMLLAVEKTAGPSVIQVRAQDVLPSAIGEIVLRAIEAAEAYLEAGALVTVDPSRHRIRLLPI